MQELMPPECIPPGPQRDAYIALLRELGVLPDDEVDTDEANETADENDATAMPTPATSPSSPASGSATD